MNVFVKWFHRLGSPPWFYRVSGKLIPWFTLACVALMAYGLYGGLVLAPADYQQGDSFRIIYIHVPAALLSMFIYVVMAVAGGISLIWRMKMADVVLISSAGTLVRTPVGGISVVGRNTQGVRIINLNEGDLVGSFAKISLEAVAGDEKGDAPRAGDRDQLDQGLAEEQVVDPGRRRAQRQEQPGKQHQHLGHLRSTSTKH